MANKTKIKRSTRLSCIYLKAAHKEFINVLYYCTKLIFLCLVVFVQKKRGGTKKVSITKSSQLNINIFVSKLIRSSPHIQGIRRIQEESRYEITVKKEYCKLSEHNIAMTPIKNYCKTAFLKVCKYQVKLFES